MRSILACYRVMMKTKLSERMAYRADFLITLLMMLIGDLLIPFFMVLLYSTGASFPGWTLHEALLIQGIFTLAKGIAFPFFFGIVSTTLYHVREGSFDIFLLKPRSVLFITAVNSFSIDDFGRVISGGILTGWALSKLGMPGAHEWMLFAALFVCSLIVLFAISLFLSGMLFKWVGSSRVYDVFDSVSMFGMYPRTIFSKTFQNILTYLLPVTMIGFLPAASLLGRPVQGSWVAALVCLVFLTAGLTYWNYMLKNYTSAGG
ncbi:ABC-2 family transporter protein [Paenibacillus sp. D2_2]|uniref:ABC transporter permease n=1 Tax=Paenibacillus sp. D2_2 TaxID=3073092 RepID=UPI0028169BCA|nr:ABC-2 family transporter protein [Paenibacillus sp. D2_2]WMT39911.1 ABC-2 family transporter protein [Paenibacillus sp. D2_2]